MQFFKDITHRDNRGSSKKLWFNMACLTATFVLGWVCYKDNMEDWAFICLYATYLITVGGFEIILKMMAMIIEFKNGKGATNASIPDADPTVDVAK